MYYVYVLKRHEKSEIYIGLTRDPKRRFKEHNAQGRTWILYIMRHTRRVKMLVLEKDDLNTMGKH